MNKKYAKPLLLILAVVVVMGGVLLGKPSSTIYEFNNKKVDADAYYEMLQDTYGTAYVMQFLEKTYFTAQSIDEKTQELIDSQEENILAQNEKDEDKSMLEITLKSMGYDGLKELNLYLKNAYLKNTLLEQEFFNRFDDADTFNEKMKPRILTHILIRTEEESITSAIQEKMDTINAALKDSDDIKIDMLKLNDGEEIIAEQLGYVDASTNDLDAAFLKEAIKVDEGTLSPWIKSSFGYHRILVESTQHEKLKESEAYVQKLMENYPLISVEIVLDDMKENGLVLDEKLEAAIKELVGA